MLAFAIFAPTLGADRVLKLLRAGADIHAAADRAPPAAAAADLSLIHI